MKNTLIILFSGVLFVPLSACKAEEGSVALERSIETVCRELSENNEYEYQSISGEVLESGISRPPPVDCFQPDCPELYIAGFYAKMISINAAENSDEYFWVYTPMEDRGGLIKKPLYMDSDKYYEFCARGPNRGHVNKDKIYYRVDHLETINELKVEKNE